MDKKKLQALFKWYMQEVGNDLISVLIVGKDGFVIDNLTRGDEKSEENKFIGAFSSLVEVILRKITLDFDLGTFGAGSFDTDKYRFTFCEAGSDYVLVSILDPKTQIDDVFPYTYLTADKISRIFDGRPVSPVIPKFSVKKKLIEERFSKARFIYKLSLVGDPGVGKTSMVQRYVNNYFTEDYKATIGTFITKKECRFDDINSSARMMIWDLAGQTQFARIWPAYLADSNAGIIVFDVTDRESFENIQKWHAEITQVASPNLISILTGNKIDLEDKRLISQEEAVELAKELNMTYIETSAKTNENIDILFEQIARILVESLTKEDYIQDFKFDPETGINKNGKYLITGLQLKKLHQHFMKQLSYCIDRKDVKRVNEYLEIINETVKRSEN